MDEMYDDERIDYLMRNEEMQIIQGPIMLPYALGAVLLAHFAMIPSGRVDMLDLFTRNRVIHLLLSARTKADLTVVEIQHRLADMAKRSISINALSNQVSFVEGDLKVRHANLKQSFYDTLTCNPPYFPTPKKTELNHNEHLTIARHEVCCNLEDVIKACKLYVKPVGKVTLVHRPERLTDIITLFRSYRIEPKRKQLVYPKQGKEANPLLIEGIRDGKPGLKISQPLFIYAQNGNYTHEAKGVIYGS